MTDLASASRRPSASAGGLARLFGTSESGDDLARHVQDGLAGAQNLAPNASITLAVADCPSELQAEWRSFQETAVATYAQSYEWLAAWTENVAPSRPAYPKIVTGRFASGELAFIWPFALHRRAGRSLLRWLAQDDSSYCMGLYAPTFIENVIPSEVATLFHESLKLIGDIDAVEFHNQPEQWAGHRNPMLALPVQLSADLAYELLLDGDFETIYQRAFGKRSRTTFRRKERRLRQQGTVDILTAKTPEQRQDILEAFFEQKACQFAEQGIKDIFAEPEIRAFYLALTEEHAGRARALACSAITIDDETAATVTGIRFQDCFYLLLASLTQSEVRRWSPGALLMREQIAACCEAGCTQYDLGPGWGRHKEEWGALPVRLFDTVFAVRFRGTLVTLPAHLRLRLKRTIKSNKVLWSAFQSVRRRVFGD